MTGSKRALAVFAAGALCAPLVSLGSPAFAAGEATPPAPRDVTALCENVPEDYDPFTDIDGNTFEFNIECLAFAEITQGLSGGNQYGPGFSVTRGQMASFIARMIDSADELDTGDNVQTLPASDGTDNFVDVADSYVHQENIDRLDEAGIVQGGPGGRPTNVYGPELSVTRAQMASFIKRALEYMTGDTFTTTEDFFTDDENAAPHEENINAVAAEGIAVGNGQDTYNPFQNVSRAQMSGFLTRTLDVLFTDGDIDAIGAPAGDDVPTLETVTGTDEDNDGVLSAGDTIVLTFDEAVDVESAVTLEDEDGDTTRLTDDADAPEGDTESTFEGSGTEEITVTLDEDPTEEIDGSIEVTGLEGFVDPETGEEADLGDAETSFELGEGEQRADVTVTTTSVQAGQNITGTIEGEGVESATVSGACITGTQTLTDTDSAADGIQFSVPTRGDAPVGTCTLTFTTTFEDDTTETSTADVTITRPTSATTRPELVSAAIVSTVTPGQATPSSPQGTTVTYTFDENVVTSQAPAANGVDVADFNVYNTDGDNVSGARTFVSASGSTVTVRFSAINATTGTADDNANRLTVATVDAGAVTDEQGQANPEGDAAIGTTGGGSTAQPAGITDAPDLASVGNFRQAASAGTTAVDFTFDENAFVTGLEGFHVVLQDGRVFEADSQPGVTSTNASGQTIAGGNGTTTLTVTFQNPDGPDDGGADGNATDPQLSASNVARGFVADGTVGDTQGGGGNQNVLQAAAVGNSGNSTDPDLVSVELRPNASPAAGDQALFTFDQPVSLTSGGLPVAGPNDGNFRLYKIDGTTLDGVDATVNPGNRTQVLVDFAETDATVDAVGGNVLPDAVFAANADGSPATTNAGATPATGNDADEEGVANTSTTPAQSPGVTAAPDLTDVTIARGPNDPFGNPGPFRATYVFDEDVVVVTAGDFKLYLADGTILTGQTCAAGTTEETDNTVICSAFNNNAGTATQMSDRIGSATLGTVDDGAVNNQTAGTNPGTAGGETNPEGADFTTGGTGTPTA